MIQKIRFRGMKIHGMGATIVLVICQDKMDLIALGHAHNGAGKLSVKSPGFISGTFAINDDFGFYGRQFHLNLLGLGLWRKGEKTPAYR
jgi:hypothetical protein